MTGIASSVACSTCTTSLPAENRVGLSAAAEKSAVDAVAKEASSQIEAAKYFSPRVTFDQKAGIFVVQFRNNDTGEVELQIPPDRVIREYQRIQRQRDEEAALTGADRSTADTAAQSVQAATTASEIQATASVAASSGERLPGPIVGNATPTSESRVTV